MQKVCVGAIAVLTVFSVIGSFASAQATLKMGDPAPHLAVAKFVKGEPVKSFEKGKIYVVEFWATWCPPCRESIPHLSAMQKANPDVIFIGSDVGEDEKTVMPFIAKMGDKMDYRVAIDDMSNEKGANVVAFMEAADTHGIPTAFVIDKESNIAWFGHPAALQPVLKQIVAGTYDLKKTAAAAAAREKVLEPLQRNDLDGAIKVAKEVIAADPDQAAPIGMIEFAMLLRGKKDLNGAMELAGVIGPKIQDEQQLNALARQLATAGKTTPESLAAAQKFSEASLQKHPDFSDYLDTLARVYAAKKDFTKAVELETQAKNRATEDDDKQEFAKTIDAYKAGTLPGVN